ncbi:MAG: hypothetical protein K0B06_01575 [Brevefilum sp.]|nr:hypothetical protein [Brevefilum sp.]
MNKTRFIIIAITLTAVSLAWLLFTPTLFSNADTDASHSALYRSFLVPGLSPKTPKDERHGVHLSGSYKHCY